MSRLLQISKNMFTIHYPLSYIWKGGGRKNLLTTHSLINACTISLTHTLTHSLTHSPTHSIIPSLTYSLTHLFTRTLSHSITHSHHSHTQR